MAATQRKLVHKQFNSPMGLYSPQNVKETLNRELKAFGDDGIEVDDSVLKHSNLANSAVLQALEEEENEQYGGYKRVAWPPVSEGRTIREFTPQPSPQPPYQQQQQHSQQQQPNYQQPGSSPIQAANQAGHYNQSQPNYQSSYPNQHQKQQEPTPEYNTPQEPYYLQQRSQPSSAAAGKPSSTVSFLGGVAQPAYNSPKPSPKPQYQYPSQSQKPPQQRQQDPTPEYNTPQEPYYLQQRSQPPSAAAGKPSSTVSFLGGIAQPAYNTPKPNPQPQYQQPPKQQQQQLYQIPQSPVSQHQQPQYQQPQTDYSHHQGDTDAQSGGRWGHVATPVPKRGYVQNYQVPQAGPAAQPPFNSEPEYGSQQQQNLYGAPSVPRVNQIYDRQPSYGPPQQQQPAASAPIAPATGTAPQQFNQAHQQPQPQQYYQASQPIDNQYNYYSQPEQPHHYQQLQQQQQYRGESPGIITLRKEAPVTQQPAPVYTSQPAAASYRGASQEGGSAMRGDLKWPPPEYKEAAAAENEERRRVAAGPACRPRRIHKDYTKFFATNALSHHYPSYKTPPGTQHMYA